MNCLICGTRPMTTRGRCNACYSKARRTGTITVARREGPRPCAVPGCNRRARSLGWCNKHYQHHYKYGTPTAPKRPTVCTIDGCDRAVVARGWCRNHYQHNYTYGTPLTRKEQHHA